jgi:hypothetical protein
MHPRIQAQREAEAAASIDAAASTLAERFGVTLPDSTLANRDPRLRSLFVSEKSAAILKEIVLMSTVTEKREAVAVERINKALQASGKEPLQGSGDADPAMRLAWYLEELAGVVEGAAPKKAAPAKKKDD